MNQQSDFEKLRNDVQYLLDRRAIEDLIHRHARGHDCFDVELLTAAYHPDGVDEHGAAVNVGPKYGEWANAIHAAGSQLCLHNITTHNCEIDGDAAHAESYVIVGRQMNHMLSGQTGETSAEEQAIRQREELILGQPPRDR